MSGVLKAVSASAAIRALPDGAPARAVTPLAIDPMIALRARIAELEQQLAEQESAAGQRVEEARAEGRRAGLAERDESVAKRLILIEEALAAGLGAWSAELAASHGLAVEIARSVLDRMIGNAEWRSELIAHAIARRLAELDFRTLMSLRVSAEDFNEDDLAGLAPIGKVRVLADPGLASGSCILKLEMGEIELGPDAQWRRAALLLDELGAAPC